MTQKFYAIKKGNGIITATWGECEKITHKQPYQFKSFKSISQALAYLESNAADVEFIGMANPSKSDAVAVTLPDASDKEIMVYTDGGCIPNPGGKGGIGVVIIQNGEVVKEISESYYPTTNNRMEVTAAIRALESVGGK